MSFLWELIVPLTLFSCLMMVGLVCVTMPQFGYRLLSTGVHDKSPSARKDHFRLTFMQRVIAMVILLISLWLALGEGTALLIFLQLRLNASPLLESPNIEIGYLSLTILLLEVGLCSFLVAYPEIAVRLSRRVRLISSPAEGEGIRNAISVRLFGILGLVVFANVLRFVLPPVLIRIMGD